jgi:tetratricopeptide (TPR) repeat protein
VSSRVVASALLGLCALALGLGGATGAGATAAVGGATALLALGAVATGAIRSAPADAMVFAAAWATLGLASTLWSVAPDATLDACVVWVAAALVFVLAAGALRGAARDLFLLGLAALGAGIACVAIAGTPIGARARAPFTNPNHLASWLVLPAGLAACEVVRTNPALRGRRERAFLWFGLFGLVGAGVAATQSLGASLAALGAMGGLALLRALPASRGAHAVSFGWLAGALALALGPVLAPGLLPGHDGLGESSPGLRWQLYAASGRLALDATPLGVGLGAFGTAFATVRPSGVPYAPVHAHADVLEGWTELGVPFALLLVASALWVAGRASDGIRRGRFAYGAATALLALALHALVEFPLAVPALALTAAALAGLTWASWQPSLRPKGAAGAAPRSPRSLAMTRAGVTALALTLAALAGTLGAADRAERRAAGLLAEGRFAEAEGAARAGLRARPRRPALLAAVGEACEAEARLRGAGRGALACSLAAREAAVAASPLDARAHGALAGTRALAGDLGGALMAARAAVRLDPASPAPRIAEAQILLAAGRLAEAAASVRAALERHPRAADGLLEALLRATGDPELVEHAAPDAVATRRSAGLVLGRAGFSRVAARALTRALELAPDDADLALEAARQLGWSGDERAAEAVLARTLARVPGEARLAAELARVRERGRPADEAGAPGGTS